MKELQWIYAVYEIKNLIFTTINSTSIGIYITIKHHIKVNEEIHIVHIPKQYYSVCVREDPKLFDDDMRQKIIDSIQVEE